MMQELKISVAVITIFPVFAYRGNHPLKTGQKGEEYDTSCCKVDKKQLELICRNEEKLQVTMTDEQKELFEKYTDCLYF